MMLMFLGCYGTSREGHFKVRKSLRRSRHYIIFKVKVIETIPIFMCFFHWTQYVWLSSGSITTVVMTLFLLFSQIAADVWPIETLGNCQFLSNHSCKVYLKFKRPRSSNWRTSYRAYGLVVEKRLGLKYGDRFSNRGRVIRHAHFVIHKQQLRTGTMKWH